MAIIAREEPNYRWPEKGQADWRSVCDLLKQAQYELVAEFLGQKQRESEQAGDALLADTLAAIRQICLACRQYQMGTEWFWQAYQEASGREEELRQLLSTMLELIGEKGILGTQARLTPSTGLAPVELSPAALHTPELALLHSLWQRLQIVLGWRPDLQPTESEASIGRVEAGVPSTPARAKALIAPLVDFGVEPEKPDSSSLIVYCLGTFRVYLGDKPITNWSSGKGKTILKYLVANHSRIHKDVLMDLFWSDADPEAARNNLNVAIYSLRQTFKAVRPDYSYILFQDDCYLLNPAVTVWVDFKEFVQHYEAGQRFERREKLTEVIKEFELAESLYQGDFLEEDLYEDWPIPRREGLKDSYLVILDRLSGHYLEEQRYTTCIQLCQKILAKDDCREDAHRRLMQCYSRQGQPNLALRQYQLCVETLVKVLDVSPAQETVALYKQIREREAV